MSIIKCKMCGGDLRFFSDSAVAECEYCGTRQTVPTQDNEKKLHLFARANRLRFGCEFDKAAGIYESIVVEFPSEAEAYWGLVLCKYGIEYVDDPGTGKKVPTCHRSAFESVQEDENYMQALENADVISYRMYQDEANQIEQIRKGIIEVSIEEDPYDIFICYKETDENGDRTEDSVLAQNIYDALTAKGYRVFFSRVTLKDKLGQAYEPYIFAALQSAKLMLVVGTRKEHFNAVWVKNEWSRFLKLMEREQRKYLIPCYKDMDAYEMPKEFVHLQGKNLEKVDAVQGLVDSVAKILDPIKMHTLEIQKQKAAAAEPLLRQAFLFLEDGNWESANEYCEKALAQDAENALVYVGKLMVQLQVRKRTELQNQPVPFDGESYYRKAIRFADDMLARELMGYIRYIRQREEKAKSLRKRKRITILLMAIALLCAGVLLMIRSKPGETVESIPATDSAANTEIPTETTEVLSPEELAYREAEALLSRGETAKAAIAFGKLKNYQDAQERSFSLWEQFAPRDTFNCAHSHTIGLCSDGTVVATGDNEQGNCNVSDWTDMKAIAGSLRMTVGLRSNGTVMATGQNNHAGQCDVGNWTEIVAIDTTGGHTVGLRADGTVVAVGYNADDQCNTGKWTDIMAIKAVGDHTLGLRTDGTVMAVGWNHYGQCNVSEWTDIVAIYAGTSSSLGLRADGTVVAVGDNQQGQCEVSDWTDIIDISVYEGYSVTSHTVGLKSDGTVVAVGSNAYGQCNVSDWTDIVAISAGSAHTVGLKADGTVVTAGYGQDGERSISKWMDIIAVFAGNDRTFGLRADGTLMYHGNNAYGETNVSDWFVKLPDS